MITIGAIYGYIIYNGITISGNKKSENVVNIPSPSKEVIVIPEKEKQPILSKPKKITKDNFVVEEISNDSIDNKLKSDNQKLIETIESLNKRTSVYNKLHKNKKSVKFATPEYY